MQSLRPPPYHKNAVRDNITRGINFGVFGHYRSDMTRRVTVRSNAAPGPHEGQPGIIYRVRPSSPRQNKKRLDGRKRSRHVQVLLVEERNYYRRTRFANAILKQKKVHKVRFSYWLGVGISLKARILQGFFFLTSSSLLFFFYLHFCHSCCYCRCYSSSSSSSWSSFSSWQCPPRRITCCLAGWPRLRWAAGASRQGFLRAGGRIMIS